jgi:putative transposase
MPGCWHHVTQRGNQRQQVFFEASDREFYLELLGRYCSRYGVAIAGYCLMGNHVHLIAIPEEKDRLAQALGRTHSEYARWLNLRRLDSGHVWQCRYYSCPLDESHRWTALRYVEQNPVRAELVARALDWPWSSATAHVSGIDRLGLLDWDGWQKRWSSETWAEVLDHGVDEAALLERIRDATRTGRPAGSDAFLAEAEAQSGRLLRPRKSGPKPGQRVALA